MLGHVLQGPPRFTHTRLKQKQTRERKEDPPRTLTKTNQQLNRATQAKKKETNTTRRNAKKTKRQTSKTEHKQDAGPRVDRKANNISPNSRIKNQGLACEHQHREAKQTNNKQTTRASNSRKLSKHKTDTTNNTKKNKARPRREKGERVDQPKVGKRFQPPPSGRRAILPIHEGVGRDGLSAEGG